MLERYGGGHGGAWRSRSFFLQNVTSLYQVGFDTDRRSMAITYDIRHGDCLEILREMPDDHVDLVFTSPPYEDARTYGIEFALKGQAWVDWAVERYLECCRVSRGLVAWVVAGRSKHFRWSATPALLMADLHRAGVKLRTPPIYVRWGIPGSGGPDWWKNRYEFIVCASKGRLPWSRNTATGHPPKYAAGGAMSNRKRNGARVFAHTKADGSVVTRERRQVMSRERDGTHAQTQNGYTIPAVANPGNVIDCGSAGGGNIGSKIAHENEAPFPEKLAYPFVVSFCPPGGIVLDPFCGSGTTLAVASANGRNSIGIDIRKSQTELSMRRLMEI